MSYLMTDCCGMLSVHVDDTGECVGEFSVLEYELDGDTPKAWQLEIYCSLEEAEDYYETHGTQLALYKTGTLVECLQAYHEWAMTGS